MNKEPTPFEFRQCVTILKSTGKKAKSIRELRELLAGVSDESIFHHMYQYFLKGHILEYTNDFAHWAGKDLEERELAELLSNIDPYDYGSIPDLRAKLLSVIDEYLEFFPEPREAIPGAEFFFSEALTFIFPSGVRARNLAEFLIAINYVDMASIYYHFYEARVRLGGGADDFSKWFDEVIGDPGLAAEVRSIDPYMHNMEGIRQHLIRSVDKAVREGMEYPGVVL